MKFVELCYLTRLMLHANELSLIWFREGLADFMPVNGRLVFYWFMQKQAASLCSILVF